MFITAGMGFAYLGGRAHWWLVKLFFVLCCIIALSLAGCAGHEMPTCSGPYFQLPGPK